MKFGAVSASRVPRSFFARAAPLVARDMLGLILAHRTVEGLIAGRIVEVEAYLSSGDEASHSFIGRTQRNAAMFGPPGHAYVYCIYGVHHCFNVVTGPEGSGEAVLVRALEPLVGEALMSARRGRERDLCDGPGKLTVAFAIGRECDGCDLSRGPLGLWKPSGAVSPLQVRVGPRIGITKSAELPLRFRAEFAAPISAVGGRARSDRDPEWSRRPAASRRPRASDRG
ncbi:MAG: DNA-3-methyladenine glycosylase [Planctomycetes bacterium]|nr:DNA-3-methyladenine glycosylase [Planctomycetota bacterium]